MRNISSPDKKNSIKIVNVFLSTFVLGAQMNHFIEMVLFDYPQHMFWLRIEKNNFQLSSISGGLNIILGI